MLHVCFVWAKNCQQSLIKSKYAMFSPPQMPVWWESLSLQIEMISSDKKQASSFLVSTIITSLFVIHCNVPSCPEEIRRLVSFRINNCWWIDSSFTWQLEAFGFICKHRRDLRCGDWWQWGQDVPPSLCKSHHSLHIHESKTVHLTYKLFDNLFIAAY